MIPLKPRCPCGSTSFRALDSVVVTVDVTEFYIDDGNLQCEYSDCGSDPCWDTQSSLHAETPWECADCGELFSEDAIKALPHADQAKPEE